MFIAYLLGLVLSAHLNLVAVQPSFHTADAGGGPMTAADAGGGPMNSSHGGRRVVRINDAGGGPMNGPGG